MANCGERKSWFWAPPQTCWMRISGWEAAVSVNLPQGSLMLTHIPELERGQHRRGCWAELPALPLCQVPGLPQPGPPLLLTPSLPGPAHTQDQRHTSPASWRFFSGRPAVSFFILPIYHLLIQPLFREHLWWVRDYPVLRKWTEQAGVSWLGWEIDIKRPSHLKHKSPVLSPAVSPDTPVHSNLSGSLLWASLRILKCKPLSIR